MTSFTKLYTLRNIKPTWISKLSSQKKNQKKKKIKTCKKWPIHGTFRHYSSIFSDHFWFLSEKKDAWNVLALTSLTLMSSYLSILPTAAVHPNSFSPAWHTNLRQSVQNHRQFPGQSCWSKQFVSLNISVGLWCKTARKNGYFFLFGSLCQYLHGFNDTVNISRSEWSHWWLIISLEVTSSGLNLTLCKLDLTKMVFFTSDRAEH